VALRKFNTAKSVRGRLIFRKSGVVKTRPLGHGLNEGVNAEERRRGGEEERRRGGEEERQNDDSRIVGELIRGAMMR
jgi:hypothetical protein